MTTGEINIRIAIPECPSCLNAEKSGEFYGY